MSERPGEHPDPRVARVMRDTGMAALQASRHVQARDELQRRDRRLRMRVLR